jgi:hypothetical protein
VGLDVDVVGAEEFLRAVDGEGLDGVHVLTAAVVALAGVALGVLVRHDASLGLHHRLGDVVLRRDHLQVGLLPSFLARDGFGDRGVGFL